MQKILIQLICNSEMNYSMGNYLSNRILFLIFCMSVIFLINYQSSYVFTANIGIIQHQTQVYRVYYFETSYDVIFWQRDHKGNEKRHKVKYFPLSSVHVDCGVTPLCDNTSLLCGNTLRAWSKHDMRTVLSDPCSHVGRATTEKTNSPLLFLF